MRAEISGRKEDVDLLFEVLRDVPVIQSSWPRNGNPQFGYVLQLNPNTKHAAYIVKSVCDRCSITCFTYEEKCGDIRECKEMLRFILHSFEKGHLTCTGMDVQKLRWLAE